MVINDIVSSWPVRLLRAGVNIAILALVLYEAIKNYAYGNYLNTTVLMLFAIIYVCDCVIQYPRNRRVKLDKEGVLVYGLFSAQLYSWKSFREAGIVQSFNGRSASRWVVLLRKPGVPRADCVLPYTLRNYTNLIWLPYSESVLECVVFHYGKLRFDQRNR